MKLIILDRDGVINHIHDHHIKTPEEWVPIDGSLDAIVRLKHHGYRIIVTTIQSGISRGILEMDMLNRIHKKMLQSIADCGGSIDAIFFCPHTAEEQCECRQPKPGMFQEIERRWNIPLKDVPCVGDRLRDLQAAEAAGGIPYLVRTGKGKLTLQQGNLPEGTRIYASLEMIVNDLLANTEYIHTTGVPV